MAIITPNSYTYVGDGVTTQFPIAFQYVKTTEVEVYVDSELTPYSISTGFVVLSPAPTLGVVVEVRRNTDARNPAHRFAHGSPLLPAYLDANFKQTLHTVQEAVFTSDNAASSATTANATAAAAGIKADAAVVTADNSIADAAASVIASNAALDASGIAQAASAQAAIDSSNALNTAAVANTNASAAVVTADNAETVATGIAATADSALNKAQLALDTVDDVVSTGVSTFNGRTGFVEPVAGDYDVSMVTGAVDAAQLASALADKADAADVAAALALKVDLADALTTDDVVQTEGTSTTDIMSQKAVADALNTKATTNSDATFTSVVASGNITAYSDERLKENIEVIPSALDKVKTLGGYTFDRKDVDTLRQTGVLAQEVQKVLPEAVIEGDEGYLSVAYGNMVGLLIEAIKELKAEVDQLKAVHKEDT